MRVYRVFDWDGRSQGAETGGPLYVPRKLQGPGRFDIPHLDGVLYSSISELGALAETLQGFRTRSISNRHFERPDGRHKALIELELPDDVNLTDLDDPATLTRLGIPPSHMMTHHREVTHPIAEQLHRGGSSGILWPSSIEGSWKNASLFESRTQSKLRLASEIQRLTIKLSVVKEAAKWLNLPFAKRA